MPSITPRELINVLVAVEHEGVVATFDLDDPFPALPAAEWFTYGIAVRDDKGALLKHFGVRFSPTQTAAFVFDFPSATQANYDASHIEDGGSGIVVRFPDSSLGLVDAGSVSGFGTVNGTDVSDNVPVQVLQ